MSTETSESQRQSLFVSSEGMAGATNYNRWTFRLFERFLRGRVLEVGCGVGSFTEMVLASGKADTITSIDVSAAAVEFCKQRFDGRAVTFACQPVEDVSGRFDAILCMNVVEHIENDRAAVAHLLELLAPGGVLFLLVPAHPTLYNTFDRAAGHHRRYTKRSMRRVLEEAADAPFDLQQYYFNSVGALGYYVVYSILGRWPAGGASGEIGFFDRWIVPAMRRVEGTWLPFGLSLISVVTKCETSRGARET
jgi:SAM-dependent methyltransferase